jgi:plasmid stabilization system protein ParE
VTHRILIQPSAFDDLDLARRWIARQSAERADAWVQGVDAAVHTLIHFPRRCPLAPENDAFATEIRQLLYGEYRILFTIEDGVVRVVHVRHGARRQMSADEIE